MASKLLGALVMLLAATSAAAADDWITLRSSRAASAPGATPAAPNNTASGASATGSATSSSAGGSALGVGSQGQSLSVDSHAVYEGSRAAASTAVAPALTSSNDTCMGSTSVGASGMALGLSFGTSWSDNNCLMLKNAREMWNMGFRGAALARMCMDLQNREALEATGIVCPARRRPGPQSRAAGAADHAPAY